MGGKKKLYVALGIIAAAGVVLMLLFNPFPSQESQLTQFYENKNMREHSLPERLFDDGENEVTTPDMLKVLRELYSYTNMEDFKLYNKGIEVQGEFYFNEGATASELESAIRFGFEKLHLGVTNNILPTAIDAWILTTGIVDGHNYFDITDLYIYIGDQLLLYHHYEDMLLKSKYENASINIEARIDTPINDFINSYVIDALSGMEASAQRSMMGKAVILQVSGKHILSKDDYDNLFNHISGNTELQEMAPGRSHVVLVLVDGSGNIYSEDVFEYTDHGLSEQDIDWMALKPY